MAISGGIKFFKKSKNLYADGTQIMATSGDASALYSIDKNSFTFWRSVSSDDTTSEVITITFNASITIDRLLLIDHNWKDFNVKYFSGGSYVHFASVVGISGSQSNITETTFAQNTSYYEFTPVTTTSVQLTVTKTQVVDAQKYISQIIFTEEIGTLDGFPIISAVEHDRNLRKKEMLSGKMLVVKSEESFKTELKFNNYPASLSDDIDLMMELHDMENPFLVWLCGGRYGSQYFKKQIKGFRLQDVYQVQVMASIKLDYMNNMYKGPVNFSVKLEEAID